ncbi:MAG TPA: hypothetical protein VJ599_08205 [Nitrososphaeraceae archaeon]|nr:hypothetical protein [Nitrososphaeraceae archaeon]
MSTNIKIQILNVRTIMEYSMTLTFFCKRNRHTECPGEWPMGDSCGSDHDCSFDVKMSKCECSCHV